MRKLVYVCIGVLLLCGTSHAVDYVWQGATYPADWDNAQNWSPAKPVQTTTGDTVLVGRDKDGNPLGNSAASRIKMPAPGAGNYRYFGSVSLDNGNFSWGAGNFKFAADNGQSGDFIATGNVQFTYQAWGADVVFDVDGDLDLDPSVSYISRSGLDPLVVMRGYGSTLGSPASYNWRDDGARNYTGCPTVIVDNGAYVSFDGAKNNITNSLEIWGTATGGLVYNPLGSNTGAGAVLQVKGSGGASGLDVVVFNDGTAGTDIDPSGGRFYRQDGFMPTGTFDAVQFGAFGWNSYPGDRTAHLSGPLTCSSLAIGQAISGNPTGGIAYFLDTDNLNIGTSNVAVTGNLDLGPTSASYVYIGVLNANSSTVNVGGNVRFRYGSYGGSHITATTAMMYVGGNWTVDCATASGTPITRGFGVDNFITQWDLGTSTVTFNGSGTQVIDAGSEVPFHHVRINQTGSTIQLDDNMVLTGNLTFDSASTVTITNATDAIIFKGGIDCETTAQTIDVNNADLHRVSIEALNPPSYVVLLSNLTISDNLNIATGCKLFIGEYTLDLTGSDAAAFLGQNVLSGAGTWTVAEGGEIIGSGVIPEPSTLLLLGTGLIGAMGYVRRRRMS